MTFSYRNSAACALPAFRNSGIMVHLSCASLTAWLFPPHPNPFIGQWNTAAVAQLPGPTTDQVKSWSQTKQRGRWVGMCSQLGAKWACVDTMHQWNTNAKQLAVANSFRTNCEIELTYQWWAPQTPRHQAKDQVWVTTELASGLKALQFNLPK